MQMLQSETSYLESLNLLLDSLNNSVRVRFRKFDDDYIEGIKR